VAVSKGMIPANHCKSSLSACCSIAIAAAFAASFAGWLYCHCAIANTVLLPTLPLTYADAVTIIILSSWLLASKAICNSGYCHHSLCWANLPELEWQHDCQWFAVCCQHMVALDECCCLGGGKCWHTNPINLWQQHPHCTLLHCSSLIKNNLEVGVDCQQYNTEHQ